MSHLSHPWKCNECGAAVFIPVSRDDITGGVCTQQKKGCDGEIEKMTDTEAAHLREVMARRGIREQPWLTLVFGAPQKKEHSR